MALRAKLLNGPQLKASIDWAARIDTPEKNELALEEGFGIKFLMVSDSPRSPIPASVDGNVRHQFPVWFGDGARMLGFAGKKVPDFGEKPKKVVVRAIMTEGKFGDKKIPEVNPKQPSYGIRFWAPENSDQVLELIKDKSGTKRAVQLEQAMQRALKHSTKQYVSALQKELGVDLIAAAWIQNEIAPEHLYSDIYVLSVGGGQKGKLHAIDPDEFYRATDAAKSVARAAFYTSINSSLLRLGELPLVIEPERVGIEGLNATLAREGMPSWWCGKGAEALGLTGEATLKDINSAIVDGSWQGKKLRSDRVKKIGYSIVLAAPKSVSSLLASSDPKVRAALEAAMAKSWDRYIDTMEKILTSRRDEDGVRSVGLEGLLGAHWLHRTSSTGDPHLHIHGVIASSALGLDGKWRTIDSEVFYATKQIAEATAMQTLYDELSKVLDLSADDWTWTRVGSVLVPEITALLPAVQEFSGASRHMSDVIKDADKVGVIDGQTWRDHDRAWRDHRATKDSLAERLEHELDEAIIEGADRADKLRTYWRQRGLRVTDPETGEVTPVDIDAIKVRTDDDFVPVTPEFIEEDLIKTLTEVHSWKPTDVASLLITDLDGRERIKKAAEIVTDLWERGLIHTDTRILEDGTRAEIPPPTADEIRELYRAIDDQVCETKAFKNVISIKAPEMVTEEALRCEREIHQTALYLSKAQRKKIKRIDPKDLDAQQRNALVAISKGKALTLITGVPGSGKTSLLGPVVRAAKRQNLLTVVVSRNALRSQETLESIGADSWVTAARFFQIKTDRPTMVFVDEGALLDTADWLNLLELAKHPNIQVVSIGDRYQNQPIDRRAAWASVIAGIEAGGTKVVRLAKSYRCRAWEDEATLLREAKGEAIDKARADGRIVPVAGNAAKEAAKLWQQRYDDFGERCIVVTATNAAAASIAEEIQKLREINVTIPIARNSFCGVGDIVRTRLNVTDDNGKKIYNGDTWVVDSIDSSNGTISLRHPTKTSGGNLVSELEERAREENREIRWEPIMVTVGAKYYKQYLELAYVTTVDTSQGDQGDRSITIAENAMARSRLGTGATRGELAPIYIVPVDPALLPPQREDAAVEHLKQILSRDDIAKTAHEIVNATRMTPLEAIAEAQRKLDRDAKPQTPARRDAKPQTETVEQSPLETKVINSDGLSGLSK